MCRRACDCVYVYTYSLFWPGTLPQSIKCPFYCTSPRAEVKFAGEKGVGPRSLIIRFREAQPSMHKGSRDFV